MSVDRGGVRRFVVGKARGLRRRALTAALSLPPVRRRLAERARRAWHDPSPVTFVCLGNICRSPFAEAVARRHFGTSRTVGSAGTFPKSGRSSPVTGVAAARDWSIDLEGHRSRVLDAELVREGGQLFVFDADNLVRLWRDFPEARRRIHLLGALDDDGPLVVADPYGRDDVAFEEAYRRIVRLIERAPGSDAAPARRRPARRG